MSVLPHPAGCECGRCRAAPPDLDAADIAGVSSGVESRMRAEAAQHPPLRIVPITGIEAEATRDPDTGDVSIVVRVLYPVANDDVLTITFAPDDEFASETAYLPAMHGDRWQ